MKPETHNTHLTRLSAIIPTWNGLRHLPACLGALRPQLRPGDEIIVVENGSSDGSGAWVRTQAPDVRLITLPVNRGFAGGTNAGLRAAQNDLLLLCNDDAFVEPGCIEALRKALDAHPRAGAAAGVLLFNHRPDLVASAGIRVQRDGLALDLWALRPTSALPSEPVAIFGASGGLALLRRAMLDDVGLFEERFFAYLEDADLAWRAQLRGWECVVAPTARARHVYSATGGQGSPLKQRLLARNRVRVLVRCLPNALLLRCLPSILLYDALAIAYAAATRQPAIAAGRLAAISEWGELLCQRRAMQSRRTAPIAHLARWLERPQSPWEIRREERALEAVLGQVGKLL